MSTATTLPFLKMNGLGNEIVVVDLRNSSKTFTPEEVSAVAADRMSRFDQMMVLHAPRTSGTESFVRIYNADGSEAGACGNGMRCVGWFLSQGGTRDRFLVETRPACSIRSSGIRPRSPSIWASRSSAGRTFRSQKNFAIRARLNCRSGRSTIRFCIRRRSSMSAIRTRFSGSTTSRPTISAGSARCSKIIRSFRSARISRWRR